MKPVVLGTMQDKHYECEFCGALADVPDEHSLEHAETVEYTTPSGVHVQRTSRVIRTRRDVAEPGGIRLALDGVGPGGIPLVFGGAVPEDLLEVVLPPGIDLSDLASQSITHRMAFRVDGRAPLLGAIALEHGGRTVDVVETEPGRWRAAPAEVPVRERRRRRWHREVEPYRAPTKGWIKVLVAVAVGVALTLIVQAMRG